MNNKSIKFITKTALFIALLVVIQLTTSSMGQIVTGSAVNMLLILAVLTAGVATGATVAVVSPFVAFLFGIGKFIQFVPVIALGNAVLVLAYYVITSKLLVAMSERAKLIISVIPSALLKFLIFTLFMNFVLPMFNFSQQMIKVATVMFGINQLITATIGGVIAICVYPAIKKAVSKS